MSKEDNGPFLFSVDVDKEPGKAELLFVTYENKMIDLEDADFENQTFPVLDSQHPYSKMVKQVLDAAEPVGLFGRLFAPLKAMRQWFSGREE